MGRVKIYGIKKEAPGTLPFLQHILIASFESAQQLKDNRTGYFIY